ncbi:hypothetical protein [Virgisporangium aurantiacum]|uniref:Uncharacterized protein n=1 Tax=Virgisporangium aurantiacum TaxID=175570 RepID=A0A8J3ZH55_9ACTN|nr:hypothetical protein [Virgisporangium aurantiacum]GIJ61298.1 hypothetical protein Vau01_088140 [Virgisporangium aurantiacum]
MLELTNTIGKQPTRGRGLALVLTALVVLAGMLSAPGPAAAAPAPVADPGLRSAADCEGGRNGFVDIPDTLRGTVAPVANNPRDLGFGVRAILYYGNVGGVQRGWAMIDGSTITGDLVWMDWTTNGGASWLQCGPFSVGGTGRTKTSAAKNTSSSALWQFRACGRAVGGQSRCTNWW